jgi:protein-S-isoprenylcysteine O-methyltransferase Ste14
VPIRLFLLAAVTNGLLVSALPIAVSGTEAFSESGAGLALIAALSIAAGTEAAAVEASGPARLREEGHPEPPVVVSSLAVLAGLWLAMFAALSGELRSSTQLVIGTGLLLGGATLRAFAILSLGAEFRDGSVAPSRVVTSGPYARLRHPSEAGLVMLLAGAAMICCSGHG